MGLDVAEIGMGLDLGLDLRLFTARSAGGMAAAAAKGAPAGIEACIRSLEEERRKIEVFRRELPLCVRLLADVIEELKEEAAKRGCDLEMRADDGDKRKWMSTAQLWVDSDAKSKSEKEQRNEKTSPEPKLLGGPMPIRAVPAVLPPPPPCFRRDDNAVDTVGLAGLSLLPPAAKTWPSPVPAADDHRQNVTARFSATMPPSGPGLNLHAQTQQQQQQQQARKARRCWSPELHRQFVTALHQLGGPQVATPKQIREVMQVDGLTNDEVKSHLQKYRLHNRRSPGMAPVSQSIMLVGGGLWVSQEQSSSQSGSPQGPLQFSGSGAAVSAATVGGDSSSSDEDDKSDEGYSQK
ncbi:Myb family transcription factor EFM [Dichanthelium oligosanthes]|uniref:Myb family transcription factor EFM n=1 Tax=Dichanthelium oligosanthes TaxID=888268 RepID=A0A1E5W5K3_9POAL|nr:Myb family transcription factor EFM [Dichanthelium oligosanthes]